ncbi:MAG: DUF3455 domain-containing protein [Rhodoferax sp.]|nr:DUF3455 domain-containing protein [Rhodoferax sp.]
MQFSGIAAIRQFAHENEIRDSQRRLEVMLQMTHAASCGVLRRAIWADCHAWEHPDGSKVSGAQVAVVPAGAGAIALQLVKANPASGEGVMQGVSYIQRVATQGGVPPNTPCTSTLQGQRQVVRYLADYIFWRAG